MKRKLKRLMIMLMFPFIMFSTGCTVERYTYAGPYHKVVVHKYHPPKVYRVKTYKHRTIYYYPAGVYYPNK